MATEIRVPTLGESVTEATIGQWFKKVGDTVAVDEPIVELETDKVTIEVPAPSAGVLETIAANPGDTVNVGALIGAIGVAGAQPAAAPAAAKPVAAPQPAAIAADPAPRANISAVPPAPSAQKIIARTASTRPTSMVRAAAARSSRKMRLPPRRGPPPS
jgi:2-oxoglutarate dehydrogenase E2 component (dihydrolipoamide succinyltransferase)